MSSAALFDMTVLAVVTVCMAAVIYYIVSRLAGRHRRGVVTSSSVTMGTTTPATASSFVLSADVDVDGKLPVACRQRLDDQSASAVGHMTYTSGTTMLSAVSGPSSDTTVASAAQGHRQGQRSPTSTAATNADEVERLYASLVAKATDEAGGGGGCEEDFSAALAELSPDRLRAELVRERRLRRAAEEWSTFLVTTLDSYVRARQAYDEFQRIRRPSLPAAQSEPPAAAVVGDSGQNVPALRRRFEDDASLTGGRAAGAAGREGRAAPRTAASTTTPERVRGGAEPRTVPCDSARGGAGISRHAACSGDVLETYSRWLRHYHEKHHAAGCSSDISGHRAGSSVVADGNQQQVMTIDTEDDWELTVLYNANILQQQCLGAEVQDARKPSALVNTDCTGSGKSEVELPKYHQLSTDQQQIRSSSFSEAGEVRPQLQIKRQHQQDAENGRCQLQDAVKRSEKNSNDQQALERLNKLPTELEDRSVQVLGLPAEELQLQRLREAEHPKPSPSRADGKNQLPVLRYLQRQREKQQEEEEREQQQHNGRRPHQIEKHPVGSGKVLSSPQTLLSTHKVGTRRGKDEMTSGTCKSQEVTSEQLQQPECHQQSRGHDGHLEKCSPKTSSEVLSHTLMKVDMDQDTVHQKQSEIDVSHEQSKTHQEPNSADETKQITLSDKPVAKWPEAAADDVVENSEKKDEELNSVTEPEDAEDENQRQCRLLQKPSEVETAEMTQALQSDQQHAMQQLQDTDMQTAEMPSESALQHYQQQQHEHLQTISSEDVTQTCTEETGNLEHRDEEIGQVEEVESLKCDEPKNDESRRQQPPQEHAQVKPQESIQNQVGIEMSHLHSDNEQSQQKQRQEIPVQLSHKTQQNPGLLELQLELNATQKTHKTESVVDDSHELQIGQSHHSHSEVQQLNIVELNTYGSDDHPAHPDASTMTAHTANLGEASTTDESVLRVAATDVIDPLVPAVVDQVTTVVPTRTSSTEVHPSPTAAAPADDVGIDFLSSGTTFQTEDSKEVEDSPLKTIANQTSLISVSSDCLSLSLESPSFMDLLALSSSPSTELRHIDTDQHQGQPLFPPPLYARESTSSIDDIVAASASFVPMTTVGTGNSNNNNNDDDDAGIEAEDDWELAVAYNVNILKQEHSAARKRRPLDDDCLTTGCGKNGVDVVKLLQKASAGTDDDDQFGQASAMGKTVEGVERQDGGRVDEP